MFSLGGNQRIYYCAHPVNLRKSFDGLAGAVQEYIGRGIYRSRSCVRTSVRVFQPEQKVGENAFLSGWRHVHFCEAA